MGDRQYKNFHSYSRGWRKETKRFYLTERNYLTRSFSSYGNNHLLTLLYELLPATLDHIHNDERCFVAKFKTIVDLNQWTYMTVFCLFLYLTYSR